MHGAGICDEFPDLHAGFRAEPYADGQLMAGMVVGIESYIGAVGEGDSVKLEQQVRVTETAYELLTTYPFEESLLN